jgi:hypothetical protein
VRKSDWYGIGISLVAPPISILLGSQIGAALSLIVGVAFIVFGRLHNSDENRGERQTLFGGATPEIPPPAPVSQTDPRIVPSYEKGADGWVSEVTDDKLILTNHGGGDAFDVQVQEIETGTTTVSFVRVAMIPPGQSSVVVPDLSAVAYGHSIRIPFHDLAAYFEEAAQRDISRWSCRITYRDFSGNWFETRFTLKHNHRYDIEAEDFVFARLAKIPS